MSELERLYITFQYQDRITEDQEAAIGALEVWKQSFPRDYSPVNSLALLFNRMGRFERAVQEGLEAQRRNPAHPFPYSNTAVAYRGLNRYDESIRTAEQAVAMRVETLPTRRLLYQLAVLKRDMAGAARHRAWAVDRAREFDLVGAEAQVAAYEGRLGRARDLYTRTGELAVRHRLPDVGSGYAAQAAWTELLFGDPVAAERLARSVLAADPTPAPRLRASAVLALIGDPASAQAALAAAAARPRSTFLKGVYLPAARAALDLAAGRSDAALHVLRDAEQVPISARSRR